jgi:hypothetical protein
MSGMIPGTPGAGPGTTEGLIPPEQGTPDPVLSLSSCCWSVVAGYRCAGIFPLKGAEESMRQLSATRTPGF